MAVVIEEMNLQERTLLIPEKADIERDAVATIWADAGGNVMRLGRFWDPPESLIPSQVTLYGNDTFCLVLEQKLGLSLTKSLFAPTYKIGSILTNKLLS
jgi:hypothetical protein